MRYMKHLSVALMALSLSAPALANDSICVPSQRGGFKIAVDPLYLRSNPGSSIDDSNFDFGVFAQIGYLFPYTGNDITLNYTNLRSKDKATMDVDTADLEIGQRLTSGAFDIRLFSGVRYNHLNYSSDISTDDNIKTVSSLFHGFGPKIGADVRCQLGSCFGFDTHLNTALLVGDLTSHTQNKDIRTSEGGNRISTVTEAKLGIDYTFPVNSTNKSAFGIELGYQTINHFSALNENMVGGSGDANFDGVYLDFKYFA